MKKVAAPLKLDLAQYRSLAAFAQFAGDLDKATRDQLNRGEKLSEITKQPQYQPLPVEKQVAILYAATTGKLDDVPTPRVAEFETQFYRFLETEQPQILTRSRSRRRCPTRSPASTRRSTPSASRSWREVVRPAGARRDAGEHVPSQRRSGGASAPRGTSSRSRGRCSSSRRRSSAARRSPRSPPARTARRSTRSSPTSRRC